jgi:hypothetical protein
MCDLCGGQTGTQTVTQETNNKPWWVQGQFLVPGFQWAADVAQQPNQQDYIGMTPTAQAGYDRLVANANDPNSPLNTAITGLQGTAGGNFLATGNPYFDAAVAQAQRPVIQQWQNEIAPSIDATFSGAGRYGSGLYANARNTSEEALARELGNISSGMAYQNYNDERGRMTQAQALLPGIASQPAQDLITAGNAGQQDAQAAQNFDWQQLMRYLQAVGGQSWGGQSTTTSQQPVYSNPLGQGVGSILALGSLFGG